MKYKETDLYPPIKRFFTELGYNVQAEVNGCDVALSKDGVITVIELKTSFNVTLLIQAVNRQAASSQVFVAIPRPKVSRGQRYSAMIKICQKLEIGLITVALDSPLKTLRILNFPPAVDSVKTGGKYAGLVKEMEGRSFSVNSGGSRGQKLMTAYREKAIKIACLLMVFNEADARELKKHGADSKAYSIMSGNHYGWFERVIKENDKRAVFRLTPEGARAVTDGRFGEVAAHYSAEAEIAISKTGG